MTIRKDTPWLAWVLSPPKASTGQIAVFEAPMPVAALRSIPHSGDSNPWSTAQFVKTLIPRHISLAWLPYGLKKHTIGQPSYSIVTDWQSVMIDAGALWVESRWMPAVNGLAASPPAQHTAPGIQQPRTTARPISQPRSPDLILPVQFSRFNPPGIITLLFSCVVTIWLTGYCILRKILSAGKKAHSEWNPPHLKYQLIDKVLIFKYMQLN